MSARIRFAGGGLLLLVLGACASQTSAPTLVSAAPGQATLTVARSTAPYAITAGADVALNGAKIASLMLGQSYSGPVAPGPNILTVTCWCSPGSYSTSFTAESGKQYSFTVGSRWAQMGASVVGGMVGVAADTAANGDQSGAFVITQN